TLQLVDDLPNNLDPNSIDPRLRDNNQEPNHLHEQNNNTGTRLQFQEIPLPLLKHCTKEVRGGYMCTFFTCAGGTCKWDACTHTDRDPPSQCGKVHATPSEARKHIRTHVKPVLCPMCQHTNQTQPIMRRHLETHFVKKKGGDALICELCNADFTRRDNFLRHTNKQHPDAAAKSSKAGKS
ncbi:unnamed protein product, partial [Clonostachys solani]